MFAIPAIKNTPAQIAAVAIPSAFTLSFISLSPFSEYPPWTTSATGPVAQSDSYYRASTSLWWVSWQRGPELAFVSIISLRGLIVDDQCGERAENALAQILIPGECDSSDSICAVCRCQTRRVLGCGFCRNMDIRISELSIALSDTFYLYGQGHRALGYKAPYRCCDLREGMRGVV